MSAEWDGFPENPALDGWHWLHHDDAGHAAAKWDAADECWWFAGDSEAQDPDWVAEIHEYLGPCALPARKPEGVQ